MNGKFKARLPPLWTGWNREPLAAASIAARISARSVCKRCLIRAIASIVPRMHRTMAKPDFGRRCSEGLGRRKAMKEYVVYRHGWNADNQSPEAGLPEKMPVLRIQANSPEQACQLAASRVSLHEN